MKKIIYFDRNEKFKKVFIEYLNSEIGDLSILEVNDERKLLKIMKEHKAELIIIDLYSLGQNASRKITKMKSYAKDKMIIVLSSSTGEVFSKYCLRAGASFCYDKNNEMEEALEIIKQSINKTVDLES